MYILILLRISDFNFSTLLFRLLFASSFFLLEIIFAAWRDFKFQLEVKARLCELSGSGWAPFSDQELVHLCDVTNRHSSRFVSTVLILLYFYLITAVAPPLSLSFAWWYFVKRRMKKVTREMRKYSIVCQIQENRYERWILKQRERDTRNKFCSRTVRNIRYAFEEKYSCVIRVICSRRGWLIVYGRTW